LNPPSSPSRRLALVTGGRGGIGAATVLALAGAGWDVAIADRDAEGAPAIEEAARALGAQAKFFAFDLGDLATHRPLLDGIQAWRGGVDCLVNNAGVSVQRRGDLLEATPESFDAVVDINLRGSFFLTQAVARQMLERPANTSRSIVTVSSFNAEAASPDRGEYCLSKAGLGMLTRLFALRLAGAGIGVFEVRPGIIRTPMTQGVAQRYDRFIADGQVPMHRWGTPEDVAAAVRALASGDLAFCTGSVLDVDGALSIPRL
jgi:NAD(P)-dependent dehydrogenase (short-subunit alcohol dehydrogenase family)